MVSSLIAAVFTWDVYECVMICCEMTSYDKICIVFTKWLASDSSSETSYILLFIVDLFCRKSVTLMLFVIQNSLGRKWRLSCGTDCPEGTLWLQESYLACKNLWKVYGLEKVRFGNVIQRTYKCKYNDLLFYVGMKIGVNGTAKGLCVKLKNLKKAYVGTHIIMKLCWHCG